MQFITLAQARTHCKADAADDSELTICVNAAEAACVRLANRNIYVTQVALDAAIAALPAMMVAANAAYEAAILVADEIEIEEDRDVATTLAEDALMKAQLVFDQTRDGLVISDDMLDAILLTTAHFYRNREEVVTGQNAAATALPMGAQSIMGHYRALGAL